MARQPRNPLLAGALAVALRLFRIHPAHALEQILGIGLGDVGRFRPSAIALLRAPRRGADGSLRPVRHIQTLAGIPEKGKVDAAKLGKFRTEAG